MPHLLRLVRRISVLLLTVFLLPPSLPLLPPLLPLLLPPPPLLPLPLPQEIVLASVRKMEWNSKVSRLT